MRKILVHSFAVVLSLCTTTSSSFAELIAYWPFDEGEGDVAHDVVGGFDGAITGGDWVTPGREGSAAYEGSDMDRIDCGPDPTPTSQDLTLAWWMIDNHASYGTIMDKSVTDSGFGYNILVRPDEEDSPLRFRIGGWQSYGGWGEECRLPAGAYEDGEWVHIVCVYDSASDTASIYVNGELPENGDFNPKTGIAGENGYCEGVNNVDKELTIRGGEETFNGVLDEVAIWDHPLTPEEVMTVYTSGPLGLVETFSVTAIDLGPTKEDVSLSWSSSPGEFFDLQEARNLSGPWTTVFTQLSAAEAPSEETVAAVPLDASESKAFYRVLRLPPPALFFDDFESGADGWTSGPVGETPANDTVWEVGPPMIGPEGAVSGTQAYGTDLDGYYAADTAIFLRSPAIDFSDQGRKRLSFWFYLDVATTEGGRLNLLDGTGALLETLKIYDGSSTTGEWIEDSLRLPELTGEAMIEFEFLSDSADDYQGAGWYLDDILIE